MAKASANLLEFGRLEHVLVAHVGDTQFILPLGPVPKEIWPLAVKALARQQASCIAHIGELWMAFPKPGERLRPASTYEDRQEVIAVEIRMGDRRGAMIRRFSRDADAKPCFEEEAFDATDMEWLL